MSRFIVDVSILISLLGLSWGETWDYGHWHKFNEENGKMDCSGLSNGMSIDFDASEPDNYDIQLTHLERYRSVYLDCQIIEHNLELTHLPDWITPENLTFLKDIEEVRGYVMLFNLKFKFLSLPKLKIIWGEILHYPITEAGQAHKGQALTLTWNPNLEVLDLRSLRAIDRGSVVLTYNPNLCYFQTIDWYQIMGPRGRNNNNNSVVTLGPNNHNNCKESPQEDYDLGTTDSSATKGLCDCGGSQHCWGPSPEECQIMYREGCELCPRSESQCFLKHDEQGCCDNSCIGGCRGKRSNQCEICKRFTMNDECLDECPKLMTYDNIQGIMVPNPLGRYQNMRQCVKECPEHMLIQDQNCVVECREGYTTPKSLNMDARNSVEERTCIPCPPDGCKRCKLNSDLGLTSLNIDKLANCTGIEDQLEITLLAFKGGPVYSKTVNDFVNLVPITKDQLNLLKNIKYVGGHVYISLYDHAGSLVPSWLSSASFLENLETIDGRESHLFKNKYALHISHTEFRYLGLKSLKNILNGEVLISDNHFLCYSYDIPWEEIMVKKNQSRGPWSNNRDAKLCRDTGEFCDVNCDSETGCWGPGSRMCFACQHFTYNKTCVDSSFCNVKDGFFVKDNENWICEKCHPACKTCFGVGSDQCGDSCRKFKNGYDCVMECPQGKYPDANNRCQSCSNTCFGFDMPIVCDGPGAFSGKGGCKKCKNGINDVNKSELICVEHLSDNCGKHGYPDYYVDVRRVTHEHYNDVNYHICEKCDDECSSCKHKGVSLRSHSCVCQHFLDTVKGDCVQECGSNHFKGVSTVSVNDEDHHFNACFPCHKQCKGCFGPSSMDCDRCDNRAILMEKMSRSERKRKYNCSALCPPEMPYSEEKNGQHVCTVVNPNRRAQIIQIIIGTVLGVVFLVLIAMAITAFIFRSRATLLQKIFIFSHEKPNESTEPDELNPDAKPNMAKLLIMNENDFRIGSKLGKGAFGTVFQGFWIPSPSFTSGKHVKIPVGIKYLNPEVLEKNQNAQVEMLEEAKFAASLVHPNLLRLIGVCMGNKTMLVTPLMPLGSLENYVRSYKDRIGSSAILKWCYQIASGMNYLEENHIIHRDLAARNVLVHTPSHVRISDFGMAKFLDYNEVNVELRKGNVPFKWLALESLQTFIYNHKTDVWAFGVTLWEIFTFGGRPYPEIMDYITLKKSLELGERLPQPRICTIDVYMIMIKCWTVVPESRPSFADHKQTFQKMCRDPPRWLLIEGDKLLRLPSFSQSDQHDMMKDLIEDMAINSIAEEDEEGRHRLEGMDVVPADCFFSDSLGHVSHSSGDHCSLPPSPCSPDKSINAAGVVARGRAGARVSSASQSLRYMSDPVKNSKKPSTHLYPCSMGEDNYLIPNSMSPDYSSLSQDDDMEAQSTSHKFFIENRGLPPPPSYVESMTLAPNSVSPLKNSNISQTTVVLENPEYMMSGSNNSLSGQLGINGQNNQTLPNDSIKIHSNPGFMQPKVMFYNTNSHGSNETFHGENSNYNNNSDYLVLTAKMTSRSRRC